MPLDVSPRRPSCSASQFQQSASISARLLDSTLVSTAEPSSFSRVTYAGYWSRYEHQASGINPQGPEGGKRSNLIWGQYSVGGRPSLPPPTGSTTATSDTFKRQFPALRPLAIVSDHSTIRYLSSTWLSHPHHTRPRLPKLTSRRQIQAEQR
jgi:hypothetical protein